MQIVSYCEASLNQEVSVLKKLFSATAICLFPVAGFAADLPRHTNAPAPAPVAVKLDWPKA